MDLYQERSDRPLDVAVVGGGISGLSAAWLLSKRHTVTLIEAETRIGGHANTVAAADTAVDTGFIVYNEPCYPNLTALFRHLSVPTKASDMSFAVSLDGGRLEYAGTDLFGLFAQPVNLVRPRFWSMLRDLLRFYREAPRDAARVGALDLGAYLDAGGYGAAFRDDHLLPMAAAIWSAAPADMKSYSAAAFIRFCENHGLLRIKDRPVWRTVDGGSRDYVRRLLADAAVTVESGQPVRRVRRTAEGVEIVRGGETRRFDHVVLATHADESLRLLADPSVDERRLLSAFPYTSNRAVLHSDSAVMPKRRRVWASWNYVARSGDETRRVEVTYWMNRLQGLDDRTPLFVTLNPAREPRPETVLWSGSYDHPAFDVASAAAQKSLWSLQGRRNTWFCGAWFGAGFHEDGLQSGLAVAEQLGGIRRPWRVEDESGRIHVGPAPTTRQLAET